MERSGQNDARDDRRTGGFGFVSLSIGGGFLLQAEGSRSPIDSACPARRLRTPGPRRSAPAPAGDTNTTWALPSPVVQPSVPGSRAPNTLDPSIIQATAQAAAGGDMPAPPGSPPEKANESSAASRPPAPSEPAPKTEPKSSSPNDSSPRPADTATTSVATPASPAAAVPGPTTVPTANTAPMAGASPAKADAKALSAAPAVTADPSKVPHGDRGRTASDGRGCWGTQQSRGRCSPFRWVCHCIAAGDIDRLAVPAFWFAGIVRLEPGFRAARGYSLAPTTGQTDNGTAGGASPGAARGVAGTNTNSVAGAPTRPPRTEGMPPASPAGNSVAAPNRGQPGVADRGRRFAPSGADARHLYRGRCARERRFRWRLLPMMRPRATCGWGNRAPRCLRQISSHKGRLPPE